jgi:hypothetical protein
MRSSRHLLRAAVSLCVLLVPALSLAGSYPHTSWCVTGDPMSTSDPDSDTSKIVTAVCSSNPSCCNTSRSSTDVNSGWSLTCVQAGAAWARANWDQLSSAYANGDYCGRYAWAEGPVTGTQQYYPRDFNLVALTGAITNTKDVNGPIAAAGTISLN